MITKNDLLKVIEASGLSRQEFSKRMNRASSFVNMYISRHDDVFPVKFSCLVAHHFPNEFRESLGEVKLKEVQKVASGLDFDPNGMKGPTFKTARKKRRPVKRQELPVNVFDIRYEADLQQNNESFNKLMRKVERSLERHHPELASLISKVQIRFLIGEILRARVEMDKEIEDFIYERHRSS